MFFLDYQKAVGAMADCCSDPFLMIPNWIEKLPGPARLFFFSVICQHFVRAHAS